MTDTQILPAQQEFTVSQISNLLKRVVEDEFGYVRVRGEISGLKCAASGHIYLSLKDDGAVLNAIIWKGVASRLNVKPEDGIEIICSGKISTYPGRSNYQLIIEQVEIAGEGALMALLEKRKKQLRDEGLFDQSCKKPLPYLPETIGVITSPTGAVIRDILHRLEDRFPVRVLLWSVLVQGEGAKEQIAQAIDGFNNITDSNRPDIIIVARGGGSVEDLWAFNEEIVVRAASNSVIPLISAVGHETDTTLIDFVSDKRAPTPTAAAELAVPVREDLLAFLSNIDNRMLQSIMRLFEERTSYLAALSKGLISPRQIVENLSQRLDDWSERLSSSALRFIEQKKNDLARISDRLNVNAITSDILLKEQKLETQGQLLESYHYKKVLDRGYALVWDDTGNIINKSAQVKKNMALSIEFADGKTDVVSGKQTRKTKSVKHDDTQESLF